MASQFYMIDLLEKIREYLLGENGAGVPAVPAGPHGVPAAVPAIPASPYYQRILIGVKHLESNIGSPCIVLTPTSGVNFKSPEVPGNDCNPQILKTHDLCFQAHCWGKDHKGAEQLANAVLTAATDSVSRPIDIDSEDWSEGEHDVAGIFLIRNFRVSGFDIQRVRLPLTVPIVEGPDQEVLLVSPITLDANTSDADGIGTNVNTTVDLTP